MFWISKREKFQHLLICYGFTGATQIFHTNKYALFDAYYPLETADCLTTIYVLISSYKRLL